VSALLRDKRFGRQILHLMSREELGMPEPKAHTAAFDLTEKYSLLTLEPPSHTRLRALVNRAFVSRNVEQLRPRIERLANELIDGFEADGGTELLRSYAVPIPAIVIAEMIGLPADMAMQLVDWSNRMVAMYMHGVSHETELDANQASIEFMDYVRAMIAERRRQPREDLLTHMLTSEVDGEKLTEEEVISTTILLLNAGHEATVHTTGNTLKSILESGLDHQAIFADDKQTEATVEEGLRFDAPLHMFTRYALLHRRAARPHRTAGIDEDAVRPAARPEAGDGATVQEHLPLPRAGAARGGVVAARHSERAERPAGSPRLARGPMRPLDEPCQHVRH